MKVTLSAQFPPGLGLGESKDLRGDFQRTMLEGLHSAVDPLLDEARAQTPYASIKAAYYSQDTVAGNTVGVDYGNRSPIFPFRENDVKPHFPPWGPGTSLNAWATAKGIPPFLVARKIARFGTLGNHIFASVQQTYKPRIDMAIQNAFYAWVLNAVSGGAR